MNRNSFIKKGIVNSFLGLSLVPTLTLGANQNDPENIIRLN